MGTSVSPTSAVMETVWICSEPTLATVTLDMRANTVNIVSQCLWLPRSISNVILKKDYKSEARSVQYNETASSNKPHL